jgi:hypothetical protein
MANILEKYGIKEVADVTFYDIETKLPVLYLDTLKVSTIEQTAENVAARGGKGNPELIIWDYNKEITLTLEDALFSSKSMAMMFGSSADATSTQSTLTRTLNWTCQSSGDTPSAALPKVIANVDVSATLQTVYDATGSSVSTDWEEGQTYIVTYSIPVTNVRTIDINSDTFPGTYKIVGDTFARSEATGKDELFQFIVQKAKVLSEVTLTMEAEGDPSTFSMNVKVLRPEDKKMIQLVQYKLVEATTNG